MNATCSYTDVSNGSLSLSQNELKESTPDTLTHMKSRYDHFYIQRASFGKGGQPGVVTEMYDLCVYMYNVYRVDLLKGQRQQREKEVRIPLETFIR